MKDGEEFADSGELAGPRDAGQVAAGEVVEEGLDVLLSKPSGFVPIHPDALKPFGKLRKIVVIGPDCFWGEILPLSASMNVCIASVVDNFSCIW